MANKNIKFVTSAKGGVGKSTLFYMHALLNQANDKSYFVDCDSAVSTSTNQLKFLQGLMPSRFGIMHMKDGKGKLDRHLIFNHLLELSQKPFTDFFMDFGSGESDAFASLLEKDFTIQEFKQIESELNCTISLFVVIGGGGAYKSSTDYLKKLVGLVDGQLPIIIYINEFSFLNHPHLIDEVKNFAETKKNKITSVKTFGDFSPTTSTDKAILGNIEQGLGMEGFKFVQKIKILKELAKL